MQNTHEPFLLSPIVDYYAFMHSDKFPGERLTEGFFFKERAGEGLFFK